MLINRAPTAEEQAALADALARERQSGQYEPSDEVMVRMPDGTLAPAVYEGDFPYGDVTATDPYENPKSSRDPAGARRRRYAAEHPEGPPLAPRLRLRDGVVVWGTDMRNWGWL